jgi:nucleotide-binding universal stress UspA family protein
MPFQKILCAVDFSSDSVEAFGVAVELSRLYSASLHVLHVLEAQPNSTGEQLVETIERANTALQELVGPASEGLDVNTAVESGEPFAEIVERARDWHADLIVLGSKGTATLEEMVIGGTTDAVIKAAPCSVLSVRP